MRLKLLSTTLIILSISGCVAEKDDPILNGLKNLNSVLSSPHGEYKFKKANYWSHEYSILRNYTDMQNCAKACSLDSKCMVASFHGSHAPTGWKNTCVLRDKVGVRHTEQPDIYSWVK